MCFNWLIEFQHLKQRRTVSLGCIWSGYPYLKANIQILMINRNNVVYSNLQTLLPWWRVMEITVMDHTQVRRHQKWSWSRCLAIQPSKGSGQSHSWLADMSQKPSLQLISGTTLTQNYFTFYIIQWFMSNAFYISA